MLVVDDKEENRYMLTTLLKGNGYEVEAVTNRATGLERVKTGGFDLIISDILMPVMDGFQLCQKVRADEALKHIPFIIYTATYTGQKDKELAIKIGADRFILKPCEPDDFMEAVKEVTSTAGDRKTLSTEDHPQEEEILKLYNERLVRKLEQKMLQLEEEVKARKEAEETLKLSNTKLQLALSSSNIGLWDLNNQTGKVWFSPEWKGRIGYEDHANPVIYDEWVNRLHPGDRLHYLAEFDAYLQGKCLLRRKRFQSPVDLEGRETILLVEDNEQVRNICFYH
ncbi:MAG TPA: response regulator [Desulfobacteraceae bacterium]|nr:response regulator [Desulfobacteraceae bacterium]HPJ69070.1 response regulator [Desulfobacteraceae bacterium]HPQ29548.1 response regulator [Desulfobacteraceae bacterium]